MRGSCKCAALARTPLTNLLRTPYPVSRIPHPASRIPYPRPSCRSSGGTSFVSWHLSRKNSNQPFPIVGSFPETSSAASAAWQCNGTALSTVQYSTGVQFATNWIFDSLHTKTNQIESKKTILLWFEKDLLLFTRRSCTSNRNKARSGSLHTVSK